MCPAVDSVKVIKSFPGKVLPCGAIQLNHRKRNCTWLSYSSSASRVKKKNIKKREIFLAITWLWRCLSFWVKCCSVRRTNIQWEIHGISQINNTLLKCPWPYPSLSPSLSLFCRRQRMGLPCNIWALYSIYGIWRMCTTSLCVSYHVCAETEWVTGGNKDQEIVQYVAKEFGKVLGSFSFEFVLGLSFGFGWVCLL